MPGSAVRNGNWKLIRWYEDNNGELDNREELFNLKNDIREKNNVLANHSAIADKLRNELDKWLKDQGARMPTPNTYYKKNN